MAACEAGESETAARREEINPPCETPDGRTCLSCGQSARETSQARPDGIEREREREATDKPRDSALAHTANSACCCPGASAVNENAG